MYVYITGFSQGGGASVGQLVNWNFNNLLDDNYRKATFIKRYKTILLKEVIVLTSIVLSILMAQSTLGEWEALTSVIEFRAVTFIEDNLYAATGGGIFEINNENEYYVHTTLDGIEGVDLSVIAVDFRSNLWIGGKSPFGFLLIYDATN